MHRTDIARVGDVVGGPCVGCRLCWLCGWLDMWPGRLPLRLRLASLGSSVLQQLTIDPPLARRSAWQLIEGEDVWLRYGPSFLARPAEWLPLALCEGIVDMCSGSAGTDSVDWLQPAGARLFLRCTQWPSAPRCPLRARQQSSHHAGQWQSHCADATTTPHVLALVSDVHLVRHMVHSDSSRGRGLQTSPRPSAHLPARDLTGSGAEAGFRFRVWCRGLC